jgi:predicted transcriptional regulator
MAELRYFKMAADEYDQIIENLDGPPEPITFLVGSWNRFEVLDALRPSSRTREELRQKTGVSRPTLSRILSDLSDHGWIFRRNNEFEATPQGKVIAAEFNQLVDDIETAEKLDGALEWLPTDLLGFDLARLADCQVLTARPEDQTGPMRQLANRIETTAQMRVIATGVTYEVVDAVCQAGLAGELTVRCVLDDQGLDAIRTHADLDEGFGEMVERGSCHAYHDVGDDDLIDCNLLDDVVMFCGHSEDGRPAGVLLSDDASVGSWMRYYFESVCDDSVPLQADSFTA